MASNYGWTVEEIYKLTLRQVSMFIEQGNIRGHNLMAFKAKLAGATGIEFIVKKPKVIHDPESDKKVAKALEAAKERLKARHGKRNNGKD